MLSIILYYCVRICCTNLKLGKDKNTLCEIKRTIKEYKKKMITLCTRTCRTNLNKIVKGVCKPTHKVY